MEYGLTEDEQKNIDKQLKGNNMDENDHWSERSRQRVEKVIRRGNFMHPSFSGIQTKENIEILEKARQLLIERKPGETNGSGK
jgi:hypothetical protein